jgi:hypothetical protein
MTWVDEELAPPGRIHWLRAYLQTHDRTKGALTISVEELATRYVEDVTWLLEELDAYVAGYRDLTQIARDANATLAAVGEAARRMAADHALEHGSPTRHSRHDRESVSSAGRGTPVPAAPPQGGEGGE